MKKDFYSWIMGVLICCACSNDVTLSPSVSSGKPISFASSESTTRAQLTTTADINSMAIFAYHTAGDFDAATATPNYMFNTPVNKVDGVWTYSPVLFWPVDNSKLSFFAVTPAPTADNGISVETTVTTAGYPTFKITPPTSPTQQADFCIAPPITNTTYDDPKGTGTPAAEADKGNVRFSFSHAMSKISFKASYTTSADYADNISSVWVESIDVIGVVGSGRVQLAQDGTYTWSDNSGTTTTYTLQHSKGELTDILPKKAGISTEAVSTDAGTLCLVPQTIPDGAQLKVIIKGINTEGKEVRYLFRTALTGTWEVGKAYTYNFTINDMDTELTTEEVTEFSFNGKAAQTYTVAGNATYKIEIWGNQGGIFDRLVNGNDVSGGKGGYTAGEIELTKGDILNIYVGESSYSNNYTEGWNGGGKAGAYTYSSPGGGSIDIRFKKIAGNYGFNVIDDASNASSTAPFTGLTGNESTDSRIIVGGGGGGMGTHDGSYARISRGGFAGGETGGDSKADYSTTTSDGKKPHDGGKGGNQTAGGISDRGSGSYVTGLTDGVAGCGGHTGKKGSDGSCAGGGGGWFGGGCGSWVGGTAGGGGGGGSSHVHSKLFTKIVLKAGNETFKSPTGEDETGHSGAGLVRITRWPTSTP